MGIATDIILLEVVAIACGLLRPSAVG